MQRLVLVSAVLGHLATGGAAQEPGRAANGPTDLVVRNANILTVDARSATAQALAIRDGVFVFVGGDQDVKKLIGAKTRVIDAQGRTVVPGLIETHVHAVGAARGEVLQPFVQLGSIGAIQDWVRKEAEARPAGAWIQVPRVDVTRIRERRLPTRAELDAAATKHPVVFTWQYANRSVQVLNAVAIRAAGIDRDTQPAWYYKDGDALASALGKRRLSSFIGVQDWRKGGVKVALNSDHMQGADPNSSLNPYNPFLTMYTAVTRKTETGLVVGPENRVSRADALRMMTADAAYLSFDEQRKGSIEVGKLGDFAILSDHLLTCDAERVKDIRAVLTVVGGRVVHEVK